MGGTILGLGKLELVIYDKMLLHNNMQIGSTSIGTIYYPFEPRIPVLRCGTMKA